MPRSENVEEILGEAEGLEKKYDWLKAAELYEQALRVAEKEDFLKKGEIQEKIGFCFSRAAMQAESQEAFKERGRHAVEAYEQAHAFYEKLTDEQKAGRIFRCRAVVKFVAYWLTSDSSERRQLLDGCFKLEEKALTVFLKSGDMFEYGRTYNGLSHVFSLRYFLEWDRRTSKRMLEKGLKWGEKAVAVLSESGNSYEIARAHFTLANCLGLLWKFITEPEKLCESILTIIKHLNSAVEFSERVGDAYLVGLSHVWLGLYTGGEESVRHFEKVLKCAEETRDNLLRGAGLNFLASRIYQKAIAAEDPDQRKKLAEEAMKFYDESQHCYTIISFHGARTIVTTPPWGYTEHYLQLAIWQTDLQKKLEFLEKSEKAGMKELKLAEDSDIPLVVCTVLHGIGRTLHAQAQFESNLTEKRSLLEKALNYRERAIDIHERQAPFLGTWSRGGMQIHLAEIRAELANTEPDSDSKGRLLERAASSMETGLELCNRIMPYFDRTGDITYYATLQSYQDRYATLLAHVHNFTSMPEHLTKAIEILKQAIDSASKLDMVSHIAESYWKIAKAQDILGRHMKAAENFKHSSEGYKKAAGKIPQLKDFYQDHAFYMEAWSEIEKARHHHAERQYGQAREHYEKAADLHTKTQRWSHLSPNYSAWARLEEAEDLSRREQAEDARKLFQQTAELFAEVGKSIKAKLKKITAEDEKQMAAELVKVSDIRCDYCLGRVALEEAKILDRQGDHAASSKKYGSATARFQKAVDAMAGESDRQELKPIVYLCQAWQTMTRAEAEASPDLYLEASQLFEEAKEHSFTENAKILALGHSRFCKALEAGTRFEDTRNATVYSTAKKHIEAATNYYLKAGFTTASEYAKATYRLFDAYLYTYKAQTETDPRKKAQFYQMAEKLLQASASSYMKANHPDKSEEVQRLHQSAKEERQLALSLAEVLHVPSIASTTTSFSTPNPIYEKAVGLDRFEHAHIQATLFIQLSEVKVGENVALEIELVNAGKGPATLVRVDEIVPAGFNVIEKPEMYRVEDSYLNMKGKRLDPLKTEDLRIIAKPQSKGTFNIKPRILYLDETGTYKSREPDPVTITVKELGIRGWIKGER